MQNDDKQQTVASPIEPVVMCEVDDEQMGDYVIRVFKECGSPLFIRVPKDFDKWNNDKSNPVGLNLVTSGHYE